jgi:hypothetical protein
MLLKITDELGLVSTVEIENLSEVLDLVSKCLLSDPPLYEITILPVGDYVS